MDAIITLKNCRSHDVDLGGKPLRFILGRGLTTSDQEIIDYCRGQRDIFDVSEIKKPVPEKVKVSKPEVESDSEVVLDDEGFESDDDDDDEPVPQRSKTHTPRGKRRKVKVEEDE